MSDTEAGTRSLVVEREMPFPPERIWRALTQPHLLSEWLMRGDFAPEIGRGFRFDAEWGAVEGEVIEIEPERRLRYSWNGPGLESMVTWTLIPSGGGTRLRMEQTGFAPEQKLAYHGARTGWPRFLDRLEQLLGRGA